MNQNLYPLWWIISRECREILKSYQIRHYHRKIRIPEYPLPEAAVNYEKEIARAPRQE